MNDEAAPKGRPANSPLIRIVANPDGGELDRVVRLLRDVLARVVWIREELDPIVREQALEDLELDLAADVDRFVEGRAVA